MTGPEQTSLISNANHNNGCCHRGVTRFWIWMRGFVLKPWRKKPRRCGDKYFDCTSQSNVEGEFSSDNTHVKWFNKHTVCVCVCVCVSIESGAAPLKTWTEADLVRIRIAAKLLSFVYSQLKLNNVMRFFWTQLSSFTYYFVLNLWIHFLIFSF